MSVLKSPDCLDESHKACGGDGWCEATEHPVPCPCECHAPKECYPGCPHPPCVAIRAARPVHTAMQAKHLSGASIGKLVEYEVGKSLETNEHLWSPAAKLTAVWHVQDSVEIEIEWDEHSTNQTGLTPNDWVRVTQVAA